MERSNPVAVLACLLLVVSAGTVPISVGSAGSPSGSPAVGAAGPPLPANNTTTRLVLPEYRTTQSGFETVRIGLGSTLQSGSDRVRFSHQRLTVEQQFEAADSIGEKRNVIDLALIDLKDRAKALETHEQAVVRNYSEGNITGETLVRELAHIDANAREIRATLNSLRDFAEREDITVFASRILGVQARAEALQGPVRHRVDRTLAGDEPPTHVSVTASDTGVVLSTLIGDNYVREATDYRNRRPEEDNAVIAPQDRAAELYPWAFANGGYHSVDGALTADTYRITVFHPQGKLVSYMDTGSADVYHEIQTLTVSEMPTTMTLVRSENGLRVSLRRTYEGGPLNVLVEDAATGAVVNAEVTVDGYELGRTGTDGLVRTIEPQAPYTVNVTGDDANLSIAVDRPFDESEG